SVLLTLQTWSAMAATVRARWPGLPWQVGPLTLAAARNPYGRAPAPNPQHRRLPLAIRDPRHDADFGAAWLAATVVTLAPLGVDLLTLLASHGPSGPFGRGPHDGMPVPAWRLLQRLMSWSAQPVRVESSQLDGLCAMALLAPSGPVAEGASASARLRVRLDDPLAPQAEAEASGLAPWGVELTELRSVR
ncbi:MAG: hypothetical protein RLY78_1273, partial [Pseudomonadota bacterium]